MEFSYDLCFFTFEGKTIGQIQWSGKKKKSRQCFKTEAVTQLLRLGESSYHSNSFS